MRQYTSSRFNCTTFPSAAKSSKDSRSKPTPPPSHSGKYLHIQIVVVEMGSMSMGESNIGSMEFNNSLKLRTIQTDHMVRSVASLGGFTAQYRTYQPMYLNGQVHISGSVSLLMSFATGV